MEAAPRGGVDNGVVRHRPVRQNTRPCSSSPYVSAQLRLMAALRLFDAHCHLADPRVAHCASRLLDDAAAAGVEYSVVNGTSPADWPAVAALAQRHASVLPAYGLHPWRVADAAPGWAEALETRLVAEPLSAMGEAGLHLGGGDDAVKQVVAVETQLALSLRHRRPLSLHCVGPGAHAALRALLLRCAPPSGYADTGLLLHAYAGPVADVASFHALGCVFSVNLSSLSTRKGAEAVTAVPPGALLLETDAPDGLGRGVDQAGLTLSPAGSGRLGASCGCDGERHGCRPLNAPANLAAVLHRASEALGESEAAVAAATSAAGKRLFRRCLVGR